ncbi:hypothetical protein D9619_001866 [Psilocybe cf. subviscida]|uniref:Uncharacterized protein n=1 Tax=Psilocybe cf. subviscida TaxID=2480587 RepID=A0A8H5F349_9AGAR|nr:hypothetical protein D9619_001866 [Psilocybe cf. subviscida]
MAFLTSSHAHANALPVELMDALNQTYFLHLLLTDPGSVIPPGKSLLSMLVQANFVPGGNEAEGKGKAKDAHEDMVDRVKEVAHRAFWAEALEALSSPTPSVQIPRLKRLYLDLHEAVTPLFPPSHPVLVSLSAPLPPTSSPLLSTLALLKDIVKGMRQRCAPVRDAAVDALDMELIHPPEPTSSIPHVSETRTHSHSLSRNDSHDEHLVPSSSSSTSDVQPTPPPNPLASFVLAKIRAVLDLAEDMKRDLNTFVLGAMSEDQLRAVLLKDVRARERQLVSGIWGMGASGAEGKEVEVVRRAWGAWVDDGTVQFDARSATGDGGDGTADERRRKWVKRLIGALGADTPVHCHFPTEPSTVPETGSTAEELPSASTPPETNLLTEEAEPENVKVAELSALPPQLFFSQPGLVYIQNYVQAITIAAALRSLTRLPPPSAAGNASDFMHRVWTLLKGEIDTDRGRRADEGSTDGEGIKDGKNEEEWEHTKLVNLADEVVRARQGVLRASSGCSAVLAAEEEERLRAAVERTLRTSDPVFLLLRKRLLTALETRLVDAVVSRSGTRSTSPPAHGIPVRMQTGKDITAADRLRDERAGKRMRLMLPEEYHDEQRSLARSAAQESGTPAKSNGTMPGFEEPLLQDAVVDAVKRVLECLDWMRDVWTDMDFLAAQTLLSSDSSSSFHVMSAPDADTPATHHGYNPVLSFIIGLAIILVASILNAAGLNLTKLDHVRTKSIPKSAQKKDWQRPLWLLGILLYILSQLIGSTLALEYMRAEYVAPLGSTSLVFNFLFARFLVGTPVTKTDIYGTVVVILGVVGIVAFGSINSGLSAATDVAHITSLWRRSGWLTYFFAMSVALLFVLIFTYRLDYVLAQRTDLNGPASAAPQANFSGLPTSMGAAGSAGFAGRRRKNWLGKILGVFVMLKSAWDATIGWVTDRLEAWAAPKDDTQVAWTLGIGWACCGGGLAGGTLVFAKAIVKLLTGSLSKENPGNQFGHVAPIFTIVLLAITAVLQIICLNRGLKVYDSTLVVPVFYGVYTATGWLNSLIFNNEVEAYKSWALFLIFVSILVLIGGVVLLTHKKPEPVTAKIKSQSLPKRKRKAGPKGKGAGDASTSANGNGHLNGNGNGHLDDDEERTLGTAGSGENEVLWAVGNASDDDQEYDYEEEDDDVDNHLHPIHNKSTLEGAAPLTRRLSANVRSGAGGSASASDLRASNSEQQGLVADSSHDPFADGDDDEDEVGWSKRHADKEAAKEEMKRRRSMDPFRDETETELDDLGKLR